MLSNEQLVELVQAGDRDALLVLWEQVRRLVLKYAGRWAVYGGNGVEVDDLMQSGFIAVLRAAETYDSSSGNKFTTYLDPMLKTEFSRATGRRTQKQQRDPLQSAASLDAPLSDGETEDTFGDMVPDPIAEEAFDAVAERDWLECLRAVLEEAIAQLTTAQQEALRGRYWMEEAVDNKAHNAALRVLRHPAVSRRLLELARV